MLSKITKIRPLRGLTKGSVTPKGRRFPVSLRLEHLEGVSQEEAEHYARGFAIAQMHSGRLFYGAFPFGGGYIVEMHDGGAGEAYTPALIETYREFAAANPNQPFRAVIRSGRFHRLYLNIEDEEVSTLVLPRGVHVDVEASIPPSQTKLRQTQLSHSRRLLIASGALLGVSMLSFLLAIYSTSQTPSITLEQVHPATTAQAFLNQATWPDSTPPTALTASKGEWILEYPSPKLNEEK